MIRPLLNNNKNIILIIFCIIMVAFQYKALLQPSDLCFFDDWCDNLYLISQAAHSIRTTGQFPILLNAEVLGSNVYQLYGYSFYSYFGLLSLVISSTYAIKTYIFFLQFIKIYIFSKFNIIF